MNETMNMKNEKNGREAPPAHVLRPRVDLVEREQEWTLVADLPGVDSDGIHISTENGRLVLSADRKALPEPPEGEGRWLVRQRRAGRYEAVFQLGEGVDVERISAEAKHGVVVLHLPKAQALQPRKIAVRAL